MMHYVMHFLKWHHLLSATPLTGSQVEREREREREREKKKRRKMAEYGAH